MGSGEQSRRLVRFGVFEVDLRTGELRKSGLKIKLADQPFQVLAMLLERPGELVTREELQKKLWSESTFVDFEHGLNKAVNRIREALGDDADSPRFMETLPRRGYRFIYPVEPLTPGPSPPGRGESGFEIRPSLEGTEGEVLETKPSPLGRGWPAGPGEGSVAAMSSSPAAVAPLGACPDGGRERRKESAVPDKVGAGAARRYSRGGLTTPSRYDRLAY
jgi:DNA-binding winged helix-turn-helix (wHTH) protein